MKLLMLSILSFISLMAQAGDVLISPDRLRFTSENQSLNLQTIGEWVTKTKSFVNSDMLDPMGAMNRTLQSQGFLTDYDSHLITYFVDVKPLEGASRVYLALFYSRLHMNKTLIRTSLFQDGGPGVDKNVVPKGNELFLHESYQAARGLNIRGSKIREMMDRSLAEGIPLLPEEKTFYENILPQLESRHHNEDFFIVAFNVVGFSVDTLGHEVAHSLLDTLPKYKSVVHDFWQKKVTKKDKEKIRKLLSGIYSSEDVIIDEFQAYLLQPKVPAAQSEVLAKFVPKYLKDLIKALKKNSLPVPFAESGECDFNLK